MAPMMIKGSRPSAIAAGKGASADWWETSCWEAKNRMKRRRCVALLVAHGAAKRRIICIQHIENDTDRDGAGHGKVDLISENDLRQLPQGGGQRHADRRTHDNVCASTDRTEGRSRAMARQWSPSSAEA